MLPHMFCSSFISKENHVVPDIGSNPDFFNQAFLLEDKKVGEPVITLEAAFVMKVITRKKSYIPKLKDVTELARKKAQEKSSGSSLTRWLRTQWLRQYQ